MTKIFIESLVLSVISSRIFENFHHFTIPRLIISDFRHYSIENFMYFYICVKQNTRKYTHTQSWFCLTLEDLWKKISSPNYLLFRIFSRREFFFFCFFYSFIHSFAHTFSCRHKINNNKKRMLKLYSFSTRKFLYSLFISHHFAVYSSSPSCVLSQILYIFRIGKWRKWTFSLVFYSLFISWKSYSGPTILKTSWRFVRLLKFECI